MADKELIVFFVANAMVGPRSWIGGLFNNKLFGGGKTSDNTLNPVQVNVESNMQVIALNSASSVLFPPFVSHNVFNGSFLSIYNLFLYLFHYQILIRKQDCKNFNSE